MTPALLAYRRRRAARQWVDLACRAASFAGVILGYLVVVEAVL